MSAVNTKMVKAGAKQQGKLLFGHIEMESFDQAAKLISLVRTDIKTQNPLTIKNIDWAKNNNRPVGHHSSSGNQEKWKSRQMETDKEKENLGHRLVHHFHCRC